PDDSRPQAGRTDPHRLRGGGPRAARDRRGARARPDAWRRAGRAGRRARRARRPARRARTRPRGPRRRPEPRRARRTWRPPGQRAATAAAAHDHGPGGRAGRQYSDRLDCRGVGAVRRGAGAGRSAFMTETEIPTDSPAERPAERSAESPTVRTDAIEPQAAPRADRPLPPGGPAAVAERVRAALGPVLPEHGRGQAAFDELAALVVAETVHASHPHTAAHLHCSTLPVAVAADTLVAALNPSMDSWDQSAAPTVIEDELVRTLAGLCFCTRASHPGGTVTTGGSESNLMALLFARDESIRRGY